MTGVEWATTDRQKMMRFSWKDVVAGTLIGAVTNIIPGTDRLRDAYEPDDAREYNNVLRNSDNAYLVAGVTAVGGGTGTAAAGVTVTVGSGGTLAG